LYTVGFSPTEGVYTPKEFAAKLNWEGRKIYWGGSTPPTPVQFQPCVYLKFSIGNYDIAGKRGH